MANKRLLLLATAAGVAAIVGVIVVVVAGTSGGSGATSPTTTAAGGSGGGTEARSTFTGVRQQGEILGDPAAPTTLTVFEDPQCPYCRQWNIDTLPTVVDRYVRTGKVKLRYRGIVIIGPNSVAGLRAIYAAGNENKLWNMVEALYERQGQENTDWITLPVIRDAASEIGVNGDKIISDADSKQVTATLNAAAKEAQQDGINGTPTFIVQKELGRPVQLQVSSLEPDQFTPALDAALR